MSDPETSPSASPDEALAALAAGDYLSYVRQFAQTPGVEILHIGGVTVRRADLPNDYLSSVFGTTVDPPERLEERIESVVDLLGRDGRAFYWPVWPTDRPVDLYDRLRAAGFADDGSAPLMVLDLSGPQPSFTLPDELEVRAAADDAELEAIAGFATRSVTDPGEDLGPADPFRRTFLRLAREDLPRWRFLGGFLDGRLVACAALYTGGGSAGVYAVATDASVRGRGFGRSVTQAVVEAGRAAGYRWSVLMASDLGVPVYERLGFREVGRTRFLRWPETASQ